MEESVLVGSEWRLPAPDSGQEYFIDKMRILKTRLRKYEDENRILYHRLAIERSGQNEKTQDNFLLINQLQHEISELRDSLMDLTNVLTSGESSPISDSSSTQIINRYLQLAKPVPVPNTVLYSESPHKDIWISRNKTLEENFKKELRRVKELEGLIQGLNSQLRAADREREDFLEKNNFIEEENNIQREQIQLLEETVRELEDIINRRRMDTIDTSTQTEAPTSRKSGASNGMALLQKRISHLEDAFAEAQTSLSELREEYNDRGEVMSRLEAELSGLKLRDQRNEVAQWECNVSRDSALGSTIFLSPNTSRSSSSNSSLEFEACEQSDLFLLDTNAKDSVNEKRKLKLQKFMDYRQSKRNSVFDSFRGHNTTTP